MRRKATTIIPIDRSLSLRFSKLLINVLMLATTASLARAADVISTWDSSSNPWTSNHWSSPLFPHNGNGGFTYDAVINGGTVTLDQDVVLEKLAFTGGILESSSDYDISLLNGTSSLTHGVVGGLGDLLLGPSAVLTLSSTGGSGPTLGRDLDNSGTVNWTGANDVVLSNSEIRNSGTFTVNSNSNPALNGFPGTNAFNNSGTFVKQGTGTFLVRNVGGNVPFNNSGTVDIQVGTVELQTGGTHSGDFSIAGGSNLRLSGIHDFAASSDVSGSGALSVSGGTATFSGPIAATGTFAITGGTTNFNGTTSIGAMQMSGGIVSGSGDVSLTGNSTFSRGTMAGTGTTTVLAGGNLSLSASSGTGPQLGRKLVNSGNVTWTQPADVTLNNGIIENNGTFTITSNAAPAMNGGGGTNAFNNNGTFVKQGTGHVQVRNAGSALPFNNAGVVDLQAGTFSLRNGGTHTGEFSIASGATLVLEGSHDFGALSEVSGQGTLNVPSGTTIFGGEFSATGLVNISGGAVEFNANASLPQFQMSQGSLGGSAQAVLSGTSAWSSGVMNGTGQTIVPSGATLQLTGQAANGPILSRPVVNNGHVNWTGASDLRFNGGTFVNNGLVTLNSNVQPYISSLGGTNSFENVGTFRKQGTGTTRVIGVPFVNSGDVFVDEGTLDIQSGGTHTKDFWVADGATLAFGLGNQFRRGQVFVETGGKVGATHGTLTFIDTDDSTAGTLFNYGTVTSGVLFEGAFYHGAGTIERNLTLRGGLVRNLSGSGPITVEGDLFIEPPFLSSIAPQGSKFIAGTMIVEGTTYVSAPFEVQGVVGGPGHLFDPDNDDGKIIIEDGGEIYLDGGRLGANDRPVFVRVDEGGTLDGEGTLIGIIDDHGGTINDDQINVRERWFSIDTIVNGAKADEMEVRPGVLVINTAAIEASKIIMRENSSINGGEVNVNDFSGSVNSSSKITAGYTGALAIDVGSPNSTGKMTFSKPATDAVTVKMPSVPGAGTIQIDVNNATGGAGTESGWDTLDISNGGVVFEGESGSGVTIQVGSLAIDTGSASSALAGAASNGEGSLANFDPAQAYTWRFIDTALGFSGVPIEDINFLIDDSQFAAANGIPQGRFSVVQDSPLSLALHFEPLVPLLGDYDADYVVDVNDYDVWLATFGSTVDLRADGNGDGVVDAADFTVWRDHFSNPGAGSLAEVGQVPEPTTALLYVAAMSAIMVRRRPRTWRS